MNNQKYYYDNISKYISNLCDELYLDYKFEVMHTYITIDEIAMRIYDKENNVIYDGELKDYECVKMLDMLRDQLFKLYGRNKYLNEIYTCKEAVIKLIRYGYDELKNTLYGIDKIYLMDKWGDFEYETYIKDLHETIKEYQDKWWNERTNYNE